MSDRTESERWFERYLRETGHAGWEEHEPELCVGTSPDYLVSKGQDRAACEVKEFTSTRLRDRLVDTDGGPVMFAPSEMYDPVREAVKRAARQLKPLDGAGLPLVVVLANPCGAHVQLGIRDVLLALYADAKSLLLSEGWTHHRTRGRFRAGGRLARNHSYISAVVTLHRRSHAQDWWARWAEEYWTSQPPEERQPKDIATTARLTVPYLLAAKAAEEAEETPDGDYLFVRVIETQSAHTGDAAPLPRRLFDGPRDERWVPSDEGWTRVFE